jgi:microcystin-dependent protein
MATIGRTSGASFLNSPRLAYITTATFNTYFFSYTTSINLSLETVGTLSSVTGASAGNCPMGRVLRENGRKLYPGANPGVTTYLVGVYDAQTMLSGFIDPNAKVFQIYNTDKPTYLTDGVDPTTTSTDLGPSVYTRGNIMGGGNLDISGSGQIYGVLNVDNNITQYGYTFLPKFAVIMWGGSVASIPAGWLLCNGQTVVILGVSVTAPDLQGRFVLSYGTGPLVAPIAPNTTVGATGGEQNHTLTTAEMPSHTHTTNVDAPSLGLAQRTGNNTTTALDSSPGELDLVNATGLTINNTGGGTAHNTMPPYYVLCYIMKGF